MARKQKGETPGDSVTEILPPTTGTEAAPAPDPEGARAALDAPLPADPGTGGDQEPAPAPEASTEPARPRRGRPPGSGKGGSKPRDYAAERARRKANATRGETEGRVVGKIGPRKADLQARIEELEAQVPSNLDLVRASLEGTAGVLSVLLGRVYGEAATLTEKERKDLAAAWSLPLAPYFDSDTAKYLPWVTALGVTYQIVAPKWDAVQTRRKLESGDVGEIRSEPAPVFNPLRDAAPIVVETEPAP